MPETTTAEYRIGNETFDSVEAYRDAMCERMLSGKNLTSIQPDALLGFNAGSPLNFEEYEKVGFTHPKNHNYYNLTFNDEGEVIGDPRMLAIYDGIRLSGEIDDPLVVYPYNHNGENLILVLDGATRASAIAYILQDNAKAFDRVPIRIFKGTEQEAMAEMVRRNLPDHGRPLNDIEIMQAIKRFVTAGWSKDEISDNLGQDRVKWRPILDQYILAGEKLIPDLVEAWEKGLISRSAAFESAKSTVEEQESIAETVNSGQKVTGANVKKRNAERGDMRYKQTLTTLANKFSPESTGDNASQLAGFLAKNRLKSKYSERMDDIRSLIEALRDDIDADLNPVSEED